MEPVFVIAIIGALILILLFTGAPLKPARFAGQALIKIIIGAMLLFFLNTAGNQFGVHVPINIYTTSVSGFLGIPGVAALVAVELWLL